MYLIARAKNMLVKPTEEWGVIEIEETSPLELYTGYAMLLAALGPLAYLVGTSFMGVQTSVSTAMIQSLLLTYVIGLVGVYLLSVIINVLAPAFGGMKDSTRALKVAVYSLTGAWLGGLFLLVPVFSFLMLLASLYSVYLLHRGLPVLMKTPQQRAFGYTMAVILVTLVIGVAFSAISGVLDGSFKTPPVAVTPAPTSEHTTKTSESPEIGLSPSMAQQSLDPTPEKSAQVASTDTAESATEDQQSSEATVSTAEGQQPSGNAAATPESQQTISQAEPPRTIEAATKSDVEQVASLPKEDVPIDIKQLKTLLPASIAGMPRVDDRGRRTELMGVALSEYKGTYPTSAGGSITVAIVDAGEALGSLRLSAFSWVAGEIIIDHKSGTGFERTTTYQGHKAYEKYDTANPASEMAVVVNNHAGVSLQGYHVTMKELQTVLASIDLSRLAAMRK
jgi:hypothetical protein